MVIVNNEAVNDNILPNHRSGYSGVGSLTHKSQPKNLFVPSYAGLNFEHIHDGTVQERKVLFEPRNSPMEIRRVHSHAVELYQAPTPHYQLESNHRYELLADSTLQVTFECIPRCDSYQNEYIGLFWASYIHQPKSLDIHFKGLNKGSNSVQWIRGITPSHGTFPTHLSSEDNRNFTNDENFPLTLVFNQSKHNFTEPWYYGVSNKMAFVQMFRPQDQVRLTQSPSGGGRGNPAWDFQHFIENPKVGELYQFVMRAMYVPFKSKKQIEKVSAENRKALGHQD